MPVEVVMFVAVVVVVEVGEVVSTTQVLLSLLRVMEFGQLQE